jgi:RNA polymerase-associated protein RTF1
MTEVRREQILEERAEERQRLQNARQIADLVRQQRSGVPVAEENVSRAAKRKLLFWIIIHQSFQTIVSTRSTYSSRGNERESQ